MQTVVAIRAQNVSGLEPARHVIEVSEGDAIMLHEDRPFITLVGPYQIQAYRNDRFEFPADTCYDGFGIFTPQGLLDATVK